jgi:hypothetical protein
MYILEILSHVLSLKEHCPEFSGSAEMEFQKIDPRSIEAKFQYILIVQCLTETQNVVRSDLNYSANGDIANADSRYCFVEGRATNPVKTSPAPKPRYFK